MHQIALAFLVLALTNSPIAVAFVFVAATIPNLLLGPIAGTFVDRWDQKQVMVVSDLLRAAIVLLIPIAAARERPARLPARVPHHLDLDLLPAGANGDHPADRRRGRAARPRTPPRGSPRRWPTSSATRSPGLFVAFLGASLPVAFWLDAATYVASAVLIATMSIPAQREARATAPDAVGARCPTPRPRSKPNNAAD